MKKIIIIDDDQMNNYICELTIKSVFPDLSIRCITDSNEALEMFNETAVDSNTTLLLDINMPLLDGWGFLEKFKKKKIICTIFILSSSINPLDREKAEIDPAVKAYLLKPLTIENIRLIGE